MTRKKLRLARKAYQCGAINCCEWWTNVFQYILENRGVVPKIHRHQILLAFWNRGGATKV
jgi:hypothetical protein